MFKGRGRELVLASGNAGKLKEISSLLEPMGMNLRLQSDWNTPEAVEDGASFLENALIKARNACLHTGLPSLADDSGLVVPALNGEPGIYSARYSTHCRGDSGQDQFNNELLLANMSALSGDDRSAYFYCAMTLLRHAQDPAPLIATASWWGSILDEPRGEGGFGYDPLFFVQSHNCSSAELAPGTKNRISHRGQAVKLFLHALGD